LKTNRKVSMQLFALLSFALIGIAAARSDGEGEYCYITSIVAFPRAWPPEFEMNRYLGRKACN
jgi:hypothetical protein